MPPERARRARPRRLHARDPAREPDAVFPRPARARDDLPAAPREPSKSTATSSRGPEISSATARSGSTEWVVQSHIKLVRNPYYWDDANTQAQRGLVLPDRGSSPRSSSAIARASSTITYDYPDRADPLDPREPADELVIAPYLGSYYYGFNTDAPAVQGQPEAAARARAWPWTATSSPSRSWARARYPRTAGCRRSRHYDGQQMPEAAWTQAEREAEAQAALRARPATRRRTRCAREIMYNTPGGPSPRIAVAIASMWKQVLGVEATITNQEWKVFLDTRNQKIDTQVFRARLDRRLQRRVHVRRAPALDERGRTTRATTIPSTTGCSTQAQAELDLDKRAAAARGSRARAARRHADHSALLLRDASTW